MATILSKLFRNRNERILRRLQKTVDRINTLAPTYKSLSDAQLQSKTAEFRERLAKGETLDSLLPEAFATVREASDRVLGLRHYDVQLIGGMVLHEGKIAEQRTGEGKTLVATLPAYLNALPGTGVHIITVNDYLAKRDAEWMGPVYHFLGLTTGVILNGQQQYDKQVAYRADIIFGTNNEYGFDYLRDNMAFNTTDKVQRLLGFAIVDEVDSILIDEARTPLIISGAAEGSSELYTRIDKLIPHLLPQKEADGLGDYTLDEKARLAFLTESGHQHIEELMRQAGLIGADESLYAASNINLMHHLNAALRAHTLFQRDVDYIVNNQQIVIVDEHTGRTMPGRRWSDGLHQAIEAKENVPIQNENQTLASITFQNYFRLYDKLSGMTGTADTEAFEFQQIYNLEVVVIPTNKPIRRTDFGDEVYLTAKEKFNAVIVDIKECVARMQPVLVGTASIETSEYLSDLLQKEKIPHQVLNAKFHEKEAQIVAEAGRPGTVTIATNMAGRGTDIVLGGKLEAELAALEAETSHEHINHIKQDWLKRHEAVVAAGGLHIIGSERHESRRIDNQLRGRSGRQGDPGSSRFYLSLEDNLMRIFASDRLASIMQRLGMKEGEKISHPLVSRAIENAQRKVEGRNFDIRKQLLEFDDVANDQRKVIYAQRNELMAVNDISATIHAIRDDVVDELINQYIPPHTLEEQWNIPDLEQQLERDFGLRLPIHDWLEKDHNLHEETLHERIKQEVSQAYANKETQVGAPVLRQIEKSIMLQVLDTHWREHLAAMDHLRQGIHLRGYAQKNPKQEYKRESFELFSQMLDSLKHQVVTMLSTVQIRAPEDVQAMEAQRRTATAKPLHFDHPDSQAVSALAEPSAQVLGVDGLPQDHAQHGIGPSAGQTQHGHLQGDLFPGHIAPPLRQGPKAGRNDPCPCGSGKKYKHCHGKLD